MRNLIIAVSIILSALDSNSNASTWIIKVDNYSFSPETLNVSVGDTIKWQWERGRHSTTSQTIPKGADPWDEDLNSSKPSFIYVIKVPGVYNYVCTPHETSDNMVGTITAK